MTCKHCAAQYIGETASEFRQRMNQHRSTMKGKQHTLLCQHCHLVDGIPHRIKLDDLNIQPIEVLAKNTTKRDRIKKEEWWMRELKTLYPYGLNDKHNNNYYSSYSEEKLVWTIFNHQTIKRKKRGKGRTHSGSSGDIDDFLRELDQLVETGKGNWRNFCYSFIIRSSIRQLNKLKQKSLSKITKENRDVSNFISDLLHMRLHNRKKKIRSNFLRIFFQNKGIEKVNIGQLLHKVTDTIPTTFKNREPPTVLYLRSQTIGRKIFNYKQTVEELKTKNWKAEDFPCNCKESKMCDPHHGHIVTGDLEFIQCYPLRVLLTKGPSYREANEIKWNETFYHIRKGINNCAKEWCEKEKVDLRLLSEWKICLKRETSKKINSLKKHQKPVPKKTLDDEKVREYLESFHEKYVITPTDKAGNNFSIICKQFYMHCLLKELDMLESDVQRNSAKTYRCLKSKPTTIVNRHALYMDKHNIGLDESQKRLPFLYWIPKMHKNPSKQRYIAASHSCSTKPLSKMITLCLKLIQQTHSNHCKAIFKNSGFNRMWIVDNSIDVVEKIKEINRKGPTRNIRTYDFSTLYTSIPHKKLKEQIAWVISQCFNDDARKFIRFGHASAHWTNSKGKHKHCWSKDDLIKHTKWLIDNIFVVCGDSLFKQVIGIPMGTDCAPFLANLFLFAYEWKWLTKKFKEKDFECLERFNACFRYIDDLLCLNNDQMMDDVMTEIYPPELSLTSDGAIYRAPYLDLDLEIRDGKIHTKLYDKRDAFGFEIVNYPDLSGNIPEKQSYGVFSSQIIRYGRCCMSAIDFVSRTKTLVRKLHEQGFKLARLRFVFKKCYAVHFGLLTKYGESLFDLCHLCCPII